MTQETTKLLRSPIPAPPAGSGLGYGGIVSFHHPGYPPNQSVLLRLPRVDRAGAGAALGVHHGTALLACSIIAGNASGRLTVDRLGEEPVGVGVDGVLDGGMYYFWPDDPPTDGTPYPVVPSFEDWQFPHGAVPDSWELPGDQECDVHSTRCIVTNRATGLRTAHLVHRDDSDWFDDQGMVLYTLGTHGVDSGVNLVKLRADLHDIYDAHGFVFVPKRETYGPGADSDGAPAYVLHVLGGGIGEIWEEFHNVRVQGLSRTRAEFHFARFARAILSSVKPFVTQGHARTVMRGGVATELSGQELRRLYGGGGAFQSPRKGQREGGDESGGELPSETEGWGDYGWDVSRGTPFEVVDSTPTHDRGRSPSPSWGDEGW